MTIKIIVSDKIINEKCNFQIVFADISNINSFRNISESNKIILKNVTNCANIKEGLPPNIDIKYPFASEYYSVNGYKIALLYLTSNNCNDILKKQAIFIKDEINKKNDYYIIFVENPKVLDLDILKTNKFLIVTSSPIFNKKFNIISLFGNDYIYLNIGENIKYYYNTMNRYRINYDKKIEI